MEKCNCYHEYPNNYRSAYGDVGVCYGTKECDPCSCGGDESKCDFYPEKRKKKCQFYLEPENACMDRKNPKQTFCDCEGDISKCESHSDWTAKLHDPGEIILSKEEEKKIAKALNTAEMWLEAQKTGGYYECTDSNLSYSKELGLVIHDNHGIAWELICLDGGGGGAKALDDLLGRHKWKMTGMPISIVEAEKLLGRRILIG